MKKSNKQTAAVTELKNKIILVTGGAGSVGTALTKKLLEFPIKQIRVIDIDEHALFKLKRECDDKRLRLLLGNILDKERIDMASKNIDILIHTAAIKNIEISEFNPIETIDTNVNGTVNLIKMVMKNKPKKFLNVSTDKVVESSTLYGVTKLLGEKITTWAGIHLNPPTKFASVRFGNVIETRGNVFEIWAKEKSNNLPLSITHEEMERYFFHINEAVDFIINSIPLINTGETFIPKMKKMKMKELLKDYSSQYKVIGLRKGEKLSEELMTREERKNAIEKKNMWIIKPKN
jgi:UDP-N-acetylglucosamine 4,6-dehydratase/5-epimerase